jgi:hypothetical protein
MAKPLNLLDQGKIYPNKGDKIVSYSQFERYSKCPKDWYLTYVKRESKYKENIYVIFGVGLHEAIQDYLKVCFEDSVKKADEMDLNEILFEAMKKKYHKGLPGHDNEKYIDDKTLMTFLNQGKEILSNFKNKRSLYFSTRNLSLVGIEYEILDSIFEETTKVKFKVALDIIVYDKRSDEYIIIDLKSSTKGWNKYQKKDEIKRSQLLLYKKAFSKKFDIPEEKIRVKYLIFRREVEMEGLDFPLKRIQEYDPPQAKVSLNKAEKMFNEFVNHCYTKEGTYNENEDQYPAIAGRNSYNCRFCEFKDREDLCPVSKKIQ